MQKFCQKHKDVFDEFLVIGLIVAAGLVYLPQMTAWGTAYPSKLMFAIFAGRSAYADGADGLGLKWPFVFGALLGLAGVAMLLYSFFAGRRGRKG